MEIARKGRIACVLARMIRSNFPLKGGKFAWNRKSYISKAHLRERRLYYPRRGGAHLMHSDFWRWRCRLFAAGGDFEGPRGWSINIGLSLFCLIFYKIIYLKKILNSIIFSTKSKKKSHKLRESSFTFRFIWKLNAFQFLAAGKREKG